MFENNRTCEGQAANCFGMVTTVEALEMTALAVVTSPSWDGVHSAMELFVLERRAEKRSPRTIADDRFHLSQFHEWLVGQAVDGDGPGDVSKALVLAYRLHMQERRRLDGRPGTVGHASLFGSQRALRTFFGWALDEGFPVDHRILKLRKSGCRRRTPPSSRWRSCGRF